MGDGIIIIMVEWDNYIRQRGGSRIFERGGVHLRSTSKKRGGGSKRGSNFGPNVKKPTSWPKGGGPDPPPPGSATASDGHVRGSTKTLRTSAKNNPESCSIHGHAECSLN